MGMSRQIAIPQKLEKILMTLYSPIAYSQAVVLGASLVITEGAPARFARKYIRPDMKENEKIPAGKLFQKGYDYVLRAYGYRK